MLKEDLNGINGRTTFELSERDWTALAALEKFGVLGLGQLNGIDPLRTWSAQDKIRLFFNETTRADHWLWFSSRLRILARAGYISLNHYESQPKFFALTAKGHGALKATGRAATKTFRRRVSRNLLRHELVTAAAGLMISRLLGKEVQTGREWLQGRGRIGRKGRGIPDLWLPGEPAMALEIELHPKGEQEYKELWNDYSTNPSLSVLYLTAWPSGAHSLLRLARQMGADFIYACGLKEFRDSCGWQPFAGYETGRQVSLADCDAPAFLTPRSAGPATPAPERFRGAPLLAGAVPGEARA